MNNKIEELESYLIDNMIATEKEVNLVIQINGYNLDALESILYARSGYRSLSQVNGEEEEEERN